MQQSVFDAEDEQDRLNDLHKLLDEPLEEISSVFHEDSSVAVVELENGYNMQDWSSYRMNQEYIRSLSTPDQARVLSLSIAQTDASVTQCKQLELQFETIRQENVSLLSKLRESQDELASVSRDKRLLQVYMSCFIYLLVDSVTSSCII